MPHITVGSKVPDTEFKTLTLSGVETITSEQLFKDRCVLIIGVIGAFTPVCTKKHIPEFIPYAKELTENWLVDEVCCICAADPFALRAWAQQLEVKDSIKMLTDTHASFAQACGLMLDLTDLGLGLRNTRYVMLVQNQEVRMLSAEAQPNDFITTSVEALNLKIKPLLGKS